MSRPLFIVAAGGLGRETAEAARAGDEWEPTGFVDDDESRHGTLLDGVPVIGGLGVLAAALRENPGAGAVICAGRGRSRLNLAARLAELGVVSNRYATVVHPDVSLSASSQIGHGSVLLAGTVLTAGVRVGEHVVCMPKVVLTHDDVLDDGATLCAGVLLGGGVRIEAAAYLGMGSSVREGVRIGADSVVGMGAVVLTDVPAGQTSVGVPATALPTRQGGALVAASE